MKDTGLLSILSGDLSVDEWAETRQEPILGFHQPGYEFLSNFYPCVLYYEGVRFTSSEQAYVWSKSTDRAFRKSVLEEHVPGRLKRLGQSINIPVKIPDEVRYKTMTQIVTNKFSQNKDLADLLIGTGHAYIEETNFWRDTFWGVCGGVGKNNLGEILMGVRTLLRRKYKWQLSTN